MDYRDKILAGISALAGLYSALIGGVKLGGVAGIFMEMGFLVGAAFSGLLFVWGREVLLNKWTVLLAFFYPMGLILSLVWKFFPEKRLVFTLFAISGWLFILVAHTYSKDWGSFAVALVHGGAGLGLFLIPLVLNGRGAVPAGFQWFSLGSLVLALMGFGLLHYFSKEEGKIQLFWDAVPAAMALSSVLYAMAICYL